MKLNEKILILIFHYKYAIQFLTILTKKLQTSTPYAKKSQSAMRKNTCRSPCNNKYIVLQSKSDTFFAREIRPTDISSLDKFVFNDTVLGVCSSLPCTVFGRRFRCGIEMPVQGTFFARENAPKAQSNGSKMKVSGAVDKLTRCNRGRNEMRIVVGNFCIFRLKFIASKKLLEMCKKIVVV